MVIFGLASTVKGTLGDNVSFIVVTYMAFILNASPPFASDLPSELQAFLFSRARK
jgi:hypothetical protein